MLKAIAFGLAVGVALQAWRNFPPDGPTSANALGLVFVGGLVVAYLAGLWRGRGRGGAVATAVASAHSEAVAAATNHVSIVNVVPGAGATPHGVSIPTEGAPWLGAATPVLTLDQVDGMALEELVSEESQA